MNNCIVNTSSHGRKDGNYRDRRASESNTENLQEKSVSKFSILEKKNQFQNFKNENGNTFAKEERRNFLPCTPNPAVKGFFKYSQNHSSLSESDLSDLSCDSNGVFRPTLSNANFQEEEAENKRTDRLRSSEKTFSSRSSENAVAFPEERNHSWPFWEEKLLDADKETSSEAYRLLTNSIKKEMYRAIEVLVEKSTKSFFAELKQQSLLHQHYFPLPANALSFNHSAMNALIENKSHNNDVSKLFPPEQVRSTDGITQEEENVGLKAGVKSQSFEAVKNREKEASTLPTSLVHGSSDKRILEEWNSTIFDAERKSGNIPEFDSRKIKKNSFKRDILNNFSPYTQPKESAPESFDSPNLGEFNASTISLPQNYPINSSASNLGPVMLSSLAPFSTPQLSPQTKLLSTNNFMAPLSSLNSSHLAPCVKPQFSAYQAAILSNLMKSGPELQDQPLSSPLSFNPYWVPKYPLLLPISSSPYNLHSSTTQESPGKFLSQPNLYNFTGKMDKKSQRNRLSKSDPYNYKIVRRVSPFATILDGLTPQHLRKAKLMFFYTRYPNTSTIKMYFKDVQFTRATTSQLIKWFSNFREFFYIQIEKFARQAINEGLTETEQLRVGRYSEVFRVLKHHFNKTSDYKVPQDFLCVTETSLREFFVAIKKGKDFEPSWKKSIYKIICKLDQEIPEGFKNPSVTKNLQAFD